MQAHCRTPDRAAVLRTAVAYSLANDAASVARMREHFAPKMKSTPDANLFAVLSADIDTHGLAFATPPPRSRRWTRCKPS